MDLLTILLIVDAGLLALVLIFSLIRFCVINAKKNKAIAEEMAVVTAPVQEEVKEETPVEEEIKEEVIEEKVEETPVEEPAKEESPYVDETMITIPRIKVRLIESAPAQELVKKEEEEEKPAPEPDAYDAQVVNETTEAFEIPTEELVVGEANALVIDAKRIPFKEKLLGAEEKVQGYYNELYNKFISYRKMHARVSAKGVSFRFGRDLVAKITYRGKTMKLHLALDINAFDEKVYFQKDMSDVKSYVEVPFTVKVKSERGVKKAIELIDALTFAKGIEAKTRFETVDAVAELKAID